MALRPNEHNDSFILALRRLMDMKQTDFAEYLGIPIGTLKNWEQGRSTPPEYVKSMIIRRIEEDNALNVKTVKFIAMLNELAEKSKNGIEDFAAATQDTFEDKVYYNKKKADEQGKYPVVLDACIVDDADCYHHDAISYYGYDAAGSYAVRVVLDDNDKAFVEITFPHEEQDIVIENGRWYFA